MQKIVLWATYLSIFAGQAVAAQTAAPLIGQIEDEHTLIGQSTDKISEKSPEITDDLATLSPVDTVSSQSKIPNISSDQLQTLAAHPQWQHLIFYKNNKAEVISANFYLTRPKAQSTAPFSPYDELLATLAAASDKKTVCRYPARYLWLSHQLPELTINLQSCAQLPNANQKISLILVSSYLKNPASSFGHVLVKTGAATDKAEKTLSSEDLLNDTYNFGARIPENDNGVMYAVKGLFGFYDAGFSETEFFKQDAVYSKNEQRDMWEYVLNLGAFETQLLNYHLYEAKSARFDYYFIKQNCGYRSGEILELISDIKTTDRIGAWYAPDYVFDQLLEYKDGDTPLIESVRYLPAEQTQLRAKFVQLSKRIQTAVNTFIDTEDTAALADLTIKERSLATDFLILHRNYKISQNDTSEHQAIKKALLSQRFMLPADDTLASLSVPEKVSPALSNKTTQTKVTLSDDNAEIGLSLFVKDPLNTHTDIDKRFEAVQLTLGYDRANDKTSLTDFVFLDMQQIEDLAQPLKDEPKLSWQLKTGARTDIFTGEHHRPYAQAGIGAGMKFGAQMLGYGMVNAAVHDQDKHLDVGLELGMRLKHQGRAAQLSYQVIKREAHASAKLTELTLRQQLSKNNDARIIVTHGRGTDDADGVTTRAAWHHYW